MSNCFYPIEKEVSIELPLYESIKGNYFIGQTPILNGLYGSVSGFLLNPFVSCNLVYVNAITISNLTSQNLIAEFLLGSNSNTGMISNHVRCVNTLFDPAPSPNGIIEYIDTPNTLSSDDVAIFTRIITPNSTLVVDGGQMILAQGNSLTVRVGAYTPSPFEQIRIAFGWYEK